MSRASSWVLALAFCVGALGGRALATPPNDECNAATPITTSSFSDPVDLASATTGPEDTSSCGCDPNGHSVWYSFVAPPVGVRVHFNEGTCGSMTPVTCRLGSGGFNGGRVVPRVRRALLPQVNYAYSSSPVLLAPERKVKMHGSPSDVPPVFSALYVKSLKTSGNVLVEDRWVDDLPCHPYP
jgi:hypothetical protein